MTAPADDDGLQFERTGLAYWRTVFAASVAGLLIVRQATGTPERIVGVLCAAVGVGAIAVIGFVRQETLAKRSAHLRHRIAGGIVAAMLLLQVVAVVLVL